MMFQFEKISVKQLSVLSEIINESSLLQKEFVESKYLKNASNFGETVGFLKELSLIAVVENEFILKYKYKNFLKKFKKSQYPEQITRNFIINHILNQRTSFSDYLNEFLSQFYFLHNKYEFSPSTSQRLKYSGLRNFLIDLEFIHLDSSETKYLINDDYLFDHIESRKAYQLSPDEFLKIQQGKEDIGKAAELQIIEYEKDRLSQFPDLIEKIEHIAIKNVMAGYDIQSFDGKLDEAGGPIPRFIEVKVVSRWDYRFYWTKNEIEKSKLYHKNYYLYLLPVLGEKRFDIKDLKIISDPYSNVYNNENKWIRTDELLSFSLNKDLGD